MTDINSVSLTIPVAHGGLEALWEEPSGELSGAAVLCHPHPQYGGTMHTKAIYHVARGLNSVSVATLRFNFRGVGTSSGEFDDGDGEKDDVRAALDYLKDRAGELPLILGGFSFGSAVGLSVAIEDPDLAGMIGLGLPVSLADVSFLDQEQRPLLLLQAANDEFGPPDRIRDVIDTTRGNVDFRVIEGTGHLFQGEYKVMRNEITNYFTDGAGRQLLDTSRGS